MNTLDDIELTEEQLTAIDFIVNNKRQVKKVSGYAGTGKTTILQEVKRRLPRYHACSYTGKAADNLRKKGVEGATTIHSHIYKPVTNNFGETEWELRAPHEVWCTGFIVDEASMVSKQIHHDLLTFERPIIYVGDHGQLEPVGADDFCLMREPDITLQQIHRNAGEIARFAEWLRKGNEARLWKGRKENNWTGHERWDQPKQVEVITGTQLRDSDAFTVAEQVICAYNRTRVELNNAIRDHLGLPDGEPVVGDKVICLQNDNELGLFNGMQGVVEWIDLHRRRLSFNAGDGRIVRNVPYQSAAFGGEKTPKRQWGVVPFDWAYAISCHKSQGSEFDSVLVLEQRCGAWDHFRWAYTAASRAKQKLWWVLEN